MSAPSTSAKDTSCEVAILPARNEAPRVGAVVRALAGALPGIAIMVVDDASTDGTSTVAAEAGARVVRHPIHLGYGAALATGYTYALRAGHERCLQLDADGQHDPAAALGLLGPVRDGLANVVIGSRFLDSRVASMPASRRVGSAILRSLARALAGLHCTDPTSGYRVLDRTAMRFLLDWPMPDDYPDIDVLIAMSRSGLIVREVPVSSIPRGAGASMHGGLRPLYYAYKVSLAALFATWRTGRGRTHRD